jgi:excisionase family DNA binding protein
MVMRGQHQMDIDKKTLRKGHLPRVAYTVPEVADQLGISLRKLRQELSEGRIGYARVGRRVLITAAQLNAYLASSSVACFDVPATALSIVESSKPVRRKGLR